MNKSDGGVMGGLGLGLGSRPERGPGPESCVRTHFL